jgi:hypothetical protein
MAGSFSPLYDTRVLMTHCVGAEEKTILTSGHGSRRVTSPEGVQPFQLPFLVRIRKMTTKAGQPEQGPAPLDEAAAWR